MSTEIQEMPAQGEIILATITKVMDHGGVQALLVPRPGGNRQVTDLLLEDHPR